LAEDAVEGFVGEVYGLSDVGAGGDYADVDLALAGEAEPGDDACTENPTLPSAAEAAS
jgi:hypothetical protein